MITGLLLLGMCLFALMLAVRLDRAEKDADYWRTESIRLAAKYAAAERDKHDLYCDGLTLVGRRVELWERVQRVGRN